MIKKTMIVGILSLSLGACTVYQEAKKSSEEVMGQADQGRASIDAQFQSSAIQILDKPLVSGKRVKMEDLTKRLPESLDVKVTFKTFGAQNMTSVLDALSSASSVPIVLQVILNDSVKDNSGTGSSAPTPNDKMLNTELTNVQFNFTGRLSEALDELARRSDLSWRWNPEKRRVELFRYEADIISLALPMGKKKLSASISIGSDSIGNGSSGSGSGSSGSSSGTTVSVSDDVSVDPWTSVAKGVQALLEVDKKEDKSTTDQNNTLSSSSDVDVITSTNGFAMLNRDLNQLVVVAKPKNLNRIRQYVEQTNKRFARNVLIDVRIIDFQVSNSDFVGADFSMQLKKIFSKYNLSINGTQSGITASQPSVVTATLNKNETNNIVSLVTSAMAELGTITTRSQGQIIAINGQPATFQQANQIKYLASAQTTTSANVGSTTALQPGQVTVGFTANFLPVILPDNRILLQYQLNSSSLVGMKTVSSGDQAIQTPEVYSQSMQQQAYLRDGQAILLFGFEQAHNENDTGGGLNWFKFAGIQKKMMSVIVIQVRTTPT